MKKIQFNKTFWMNLNLSLLAIFTCFMFFFVNIDYIEARLIDKVMSILFLLVPIFSAVTFYKNNHGYFYKITLLLNLIFSLMIAWFALRNLYHHSWDSFIFMLAWMTPFIINVKQLIKTKNNYLQC